MGVHITTRAVRIIMLLNRIDWYMYFHGFVLISKNIKNAKHKMAKQKAIVMCLEYLILCVGDMLNGHRETALLIP